jgi:ubiquinone biosynthesis protein
LGPLASVVINYLRSKPDLLPQFDHWIVPLPAAPSEALSFALVRKVVAEDIGEDIEAVFSWFDPAPVRYGPLAQVHVARTVGEREIVVKLRRPDAAEIVARELSILERAMRTLAQLAELSEVESSELEQGLRKWLTQEIDAPGELANLERLQVPGSSDPGSVMPRPRRDLSGPRVFACEMARGVPVKELIRMVSTKRADRIERLDLVPIDVANNLVRAVLHQMFVAESFVTTVVPESVVALPDDRVSFLDFNRVGRIDPLIRKNQFRYLTAIGAGDVERILGAINELAESPSSEATEAFAVDFRRQMRAWERERQSETAVAEPIADHLVQTLRLARAHGLRFGDPVLTLVRTLWVADCTAKQLAADAGLGAAARAFLSRRWMVGYAQELWQERFPGLGFDLVDLLTDGPGNLVRILSDVADRRFVLRVQAAESEESLHAAAVRSRLMATSWLIVAVSILASALWLSASTSPLAWIIVGVPGLALLALFAVLWMRLS